MKRTAIIFSALLMGSAMANYPALAQSADGSSGMSNGSSGMSNGSMSTMDGDNTGAMDQKNMQTDTMSTGSTTGGAMMTNAQVVGQLQTMDIAAVNVLRLNDLATPDTNATSSGVPTNTTPAEQEELQAAVESNSKLMDALKKQAVDPSQVVAANIDGNNTVTLYVK